MVKGLKWKRYESDSRKDAGKSALLERAKDILRRDYGKYEVVDAYLEGTFYLVGGRVAKTEEDVRGELEAIELAYETKEDLESLLKTLKLPRSLKSESS